MQRTQATVPGIDTYLPREGTETRNMQRTQATVPGIDPYLPREGPETMSPFV